MRGRISAALFRFGIAFLCCASALAQQPFQTTDPYESRFKVKPNFQIRFRVPERGGEVRLRTSQPVRYEKDVSWEGSGDVVIEYQDIKITADRARYDFPTDTATLEGNVVIDQGPTRLSGARATFQVKAKTGRLENATADLAPTYHIVARAIAKIGETTYRVEDGLFTSCDLPNPEWSFHLSEATVTLDDYARMRNVSFRAGPVPLLYTPYLVWPTKEDRASGLLVPGIGFSSRRGAYLGLSHYWVTGRSTDLTTQLDLYSEGALGLGEEFRWAPSPESAGVFQGYAIKDPKATVCVEPATEPGGGLGRCTLPNSKPGVFARRERDRWKARLDHVSNDLPYGFRGVVAIREYSDEEYLRDIERSFALSSARQTLSQGFLTKNFGENSVNLRVERSETFFGTKVIQQRLPTLEYSRRTSRIGKTPLYFALESSLSHLSIDKGRDTAGSLLHGSYERFDVHPTLSLPWKTIPWLSVTASAGGRWTGYSDSTNPAGRLFVGSSYTREYGEAGLALVGPSFSRIYEASIGSFGRFKHVIEPRVEYEYASRVEDPFRIPRFDGTDEALGRNGVRYALVNRLLARPADPKAGSAQEVASLEISQTHAVEPPQSPLVFPKTGPVEGILRVAPAPLLQLDGSLTYDQHASQVTGTSLAVTASWKTNYFKGTWSARRPVPISPLPPGIPSQDSDQIRLAIGADLSNSFRIDTELNYEVRQVADVRGPVTRGLLQEDRSLLTFQGSCYTIFLEVRQLRLPPDTRRDYRLVINLKDIGTLLDIHGGLNRLF